MELQNSEFYITFVTAIRITVPSGPGKVFEAFFF